MRSCVLLYSAAGSSVHTTCCLLPVWLTVLHTTTASSSCVWTSVDYVVLRALCLFCYSNEQHALKVKHVVVFSVNPRAILPVCATCAFLGSDCGSAVFILCYIYSKHAVAPPHTTTSVQD